MKINGKVHFIGQEKKVSDKFKSRDLVLMTEDKYPQPLIFQLSQDKTDLADNLKVGDGVEVSINLRGREWKSPSGEIKYFNTLDIWSIQYTNNVSGVGYVAENQINEKDDLPF